MYNFEIKWVSPLGSQNGKISFRTPSGRWDRDGEHNVLLGVTPLIWDLHVWRSWREKPTTTSSYSNFPAEYRSHDLFIIFERMVDYSTRRPSSAATADYGGAANGADLMDGSCTQNLTRLSLSILEKKKMLREVLQVLRAGLPLRVLPCLHHIIRTIHISLMMTHCVISNNFHS